MKAHNTKSKVIQGLKLLFGLALIVLIISRIDVRGVPEALRSGEVRYLIWGFVFFSFSLVGCVLRLHTIIRKYSLRIRHSMKVHFIGLFYSNFLPTSVGGDIYKAYYLQRNCNWSKAISLTLFERIIGLFVLVVMGLAVFLFDYANLIKIFQEQEIAFSSKRTIFVVLGVIAILALGIFLFRKRFGKFAATVVYNAHEALSALKRITALEFAVIIVLTLALHLVRALGFYMFILFLNCHITWYYLILINTLLAIASMAPISIGGLGVKEGTLVVTLLAFGLPEHAAVAIALFNRLVIWIFALVGGAYFIFERISSRAPSPAKP